MTENELKYVVKRFLKIKQNAYQSRYNDETELCQFVLLGYSYADIKNFIKENPDIYKDAQEFSRLLSYM